MSNITFEDIKKANETIQTTDIKGKEYAEVNQRIKAFRMIYPNGCILTEMINNENGVCIFKATILDEEGTALATGTAYEKENSTFINKTSYIENCETSAVGRALGMAGFGIDTSVASAEEVQNAMANQEPTLEEAQNYVLTFGKHKDKKLIELPKDYINWLLANTKDDYIRKCLELLGFKMPSKEEQEKILDLITTLNELLDETNTDRNKFYEYYNVNSNNEMTLEQLKSAIEILKNKLGEN